MGIPMEQSVSECGVCDVDLEIGEAVFDTKAGDEHVINAFTETRLLLSEGCYGTENCDSSAQCESRATLPIAADYSDNLMESVQLLVDRKVGVGENYESVLEKKSVKEKPKAMSGKKPPKPPRPPRGLSLDSTDQKIIRELADMAKLKRARMERMRALKKMKEARTSSSKNQLFATLFTVLFCLVILFQGISSRTGSASTFQGSPVTSRATDRGLFPMMHLPNMPVKGSDSHSLLQQVSITNTQEEVRRVAD